ncbi:MAG: hypothetical protein ACLFM7_13795 [Bacteroidales bacterium]
MLLTKQEQSAIYKRLKKQDVIAIDGRHYWMENGNLIEPCTHEELDVIKELADQGKVKYEKETRKL